MKKGKLTTHFKANLDSSSFFGDVIDDSQFWEPLPKPKTEGVKNDKK